MEYRLARIEPNEKYKPPREKIVTKGRSESKRNSPKESNAVLLKSSPQIVIHVRDEPRNVVRDFICPRNVLMREMHYFKSYLTNKHDVDISVHCDVHVFEWLMVYARDKKNIPEIDVRSAVSILIASDFLGMPSLLDLVLKFVGTNLDRILNLPIDLECIHNKLVDRLVEYVTIETLDRAKDHQKKLLPRLFKAKTKELLRRHEGIFTWCVKCCRIYSKNWENKLICPVATPSVDFHGVIRQSHISQEDWNPVNDFCEPLRRDFDIPWSSIFWTLWSATKLFRCLDCDYDFDGLSLKDCFRHRLEHGEVGKPCLSRCGTQTVFSCCGAQIPLVDPILIMPERSGCFQGWHRRDPGFEKGSIQRNYELAQKHLEKMKSTLSSLAPQHMSIPQSENLVLSASSWIESPSSVRVEDEFTPCPKPGLWIQERQRDEEVVHMQQLMEQLRLLRDK